MVAKSAQVTSLSKNGEGKDGSNAWDRSETAVVGVVAEKGLRQVFQLGPLLAKS